jgi:tyrosyl-tRNA synthetase
MKLSDALIERGFIHQYSAETLAEIVDGPPRTIYHGIDPTADSAHAGNFVVWMLLRHLAAAGHRIIFLVGGGTGMIGDPKSDAERVLQDEAVTDANVAAIKAQAEQLIGTADNQITFVNNKDWLGEQKLIDFLRDIGKHFTVNELIKKDAIAARLQSEVGLSYTEFAYPLLQAFDYRTLYQTHQCEVQVGGSDQWGNMVAGVDLIRRTEQATVYAITTPLVVDSVTGKKFGKSEGNAIWLDAEKTSSYTFYQFWLNQNDEDVVAHLKRYTLLSLEDISALEEAQQSDPGGRPAQRALAREVTTLVHGTSAATAAERVSGLLFGTGSLEDLTEDECTMLVANAPHQVVAPGDLVRDVLVSTGLAASGREARTFIDSGAIECAGARVNDTEATITPTMFTNGLTLLKRGKRHVSVLSLSE